MNTEIALGVSGDMGSFSEEAGLLYAQRINTPSHLVYLLDMEGVLLAVEEGSVDIGIFPVVNMRGGLVTMAFEAMGKHLFTPIDEVWLDVRQCLLAQFGTQMHEIQSVVSHPQAIAQCQIYLQQTLPNIALINWIDTAKAAKDLGEGILNNVTAVIAPERSAQLYGLEMLAKNIQDNHPNLTAFIVVKKKV